MFKTFSAAPTAAEKSLFFYKFIQSPKQVGSITPSSRFLARKIMDSVHWEQINTIGELGAGTGVFTQYIHAYRKPDCQVAVFEKDADMRLSLAQRFPEFHCFPDAQELTGSLANLNLENLDCIVSGLPFTNFSAEMRGHILDEVYAALPAGGHFITFQYSLHMKKQLRERFSSVQINFVLLNFPPAFVFVCRK